MIVMTMWDACAVFGLVVAPTTMICMGAHIQDLGDRINELEKQLKELRNRNRC